MVENYRHKVQYYETDKMGITHHSNYIRFMEETRTDFMEQIGFGYDRMEADGVGSPVMSVTCEYKKPTTFPDIIEVQVRVAEISRLKVKFDYRMTVGGALVCHGTSLHCFLNREGRPISLEDNYPQLYEAMLPYLLPDAQIK